MATLIPEITLTEFKKLKADELKQLKCCEVYYNYDYLFTFVNPRTDYVRVQTEYMGEMSNTVGGKELGEIRAEYATIRV